MKNQKKSHISIEELNALMEKSIQDTIKLKEAQRQTDEQMKQTDEQMKRTDEQMKRTDEKLERIGLRLGNIQNNIGEEAEETFYHYLANKMELNNIKFDSLFRRAIDKKGNEYDMVMQNGEYNALIEVKYKAHVNDLDKLIKKQLVHFKKNLAKNKKTIVALATPIVTDLIRKKAAELGALLITQNGGNVKIDNSPHFKMKTY